MSSLHALTVDPRVKVAAFAASMAVVFLCHDIYVLAAVFATSLVVAVLSQERARIFKGLKVMLPALVVALILWSTLYRFSLFYKYGGTGFNIYVGAFMAFRFLVIITVSLTFIYTTTPRELVAALSSMGLPYRVSLILGLSLRHVHTTSDEYRAIKEAQTSRGLELDRGLLITRIKNYIPVVLPLLVRSIENAERLVLAMELRFFSFKGKRTKFFRPKMSGVDYAILAALAAAVALTVLHYVFRVV